MPPRAPGEALSVIVPRAHAAQRRTPSASGHRRLHRSQRGMTRASASQCIDSFASDSTSRQWQESIMNKNGLTGTEDNTVEDKLDSIRDSVKGVVERGAQKAEAIKHKVVEVKDQAMHRGSE